ncbi:MAG: hypothetical protein ACOYUZ_00200 [Patescibacteria group bacterium]
MKLRGTEFGHVFCASGARNFFGEGWPYHESFKHFGLDYTGSTLITKTTTIDPRKGNMPLKEDSTQPVERFPKCIIVKPFHGVALNSVGLSGPGLQWLLKQNRWQRLTEPFVISFMAVGQDHKERLQEYERLAEMMLPALKNFQTSIAVEINISCPNVHIHQSELIDEAKEYLNMVAGLKVPIIVKINALLAEAQAAKLTEHPACDGLDISNTIPYGQIPDIIPWEKFFGTNGSPLGHLGGGGLSGAPLLPIVTDWIKNFRRKYSYTFPIIGGGGILSPDDADLMLNTGADAISLGCISMLRPWRVQRTIRQINNRFLNRSIHASFGISGPCTKGDST